MKRNEWEVGHTVQEEPTEKLIKTTYRISIPI